MRSWTAVTIMPSWGCASPLCDTTCNGAQECVTEVKLIAGAVSFAHIWLMINTGSCWLQAALKRFQLDYVDLVFCHRPDVYTPIEETVRAMNFVIEQGWAFYWGTSEWSAQQITEVSHDQLSNSVYVNIIAIWSLGYTGRRRYALLFTQDVSLYPWTKLLHIPWHATGGMCSAQERYAVISVLLSASVDVHLAVLVCFPCTQKLHSLYPEAAQPHSFLVSPIPAVIPHPKGISSCSDCMSVNDTGAC